MIAKEKQKVFKEAQQTLKQKFKRRQALSIFKKQLHKTRS